MEKYLKESHGLIVYQDDLLFSAIELAGYSWLEADKFRKAVGKKIPKEMAAQKEKLVLGIVKNGQTPAFAEKLWKLFEPFQAYGFNKSHAASYGRVAYQTSYMKANFPTAYMAAVLTADSGDIEKIAEIVTEVKKMGIEVLPPDINESFEDFTVVKNEETSKPARHASRDLRGVAGGENIRFGLTTIKNFGAGIAHAIIEERKKDGVFKSLADFLGRVKDKNLNKKSLEALVQCGALDSFGERGEMFANMEKLLQFSKESNASSKNQDSLFGASGSVVSIRLDKAPNASVEQKLAWEKELLGLYISGHPLDKFREKLENRTGTIEAVKKEARPGTTVVVAGIVSEAKTILTKKGDKMAFLKISDFSGTVEAVAFPRIIETYPQFCQPEQCIAIKGKLSDRNGELSVIIDKMKAL